MKFSTTFRRTFPVTLAFAQGRLEELFDEVYTPNENNLNAKCDAAAMLVAQHWMEVETLATRHWGVAYGEPSRENYLYDMFVEQPGSLIETLSDLSGSRTIYSDALSALEILKSARRLSAWGLSSPKDKRGSP